MLFKICQKIWSTGKPVHEDDVERFYRRPCEGIAGALQTLIRFGNTHSVGCRVFDEREGIG